MARTLWIPFVMRRLLPLLILSACLCSSPDLWAGDIKISGLQFPVGQPADRPVARIAISEITQGAQKRGFLRVALLPLILARGVDIRFERKGFAALEEVCDILRSLVKLDAQEFHNVRIFSGADPEPRLVAAEAMPKSGIWLLKGVRIRLDGAYRDFSECSLALSGAKAGECTFANGKGAFSVDLNDLPP